MVRQKCHKSTAKIYSKINSLFTFMYKITYHLKWFYFYTLYVGIALRKKIRKKGTDNIEVLEMSSTFWLGLLNGHITTTCVMPIFMNHEEMISSSKETFGLYFIIPFLIKHGFDSFYFYWNKYWLKITQEFENNISKTTKNTYLTIFIILLILSFCFMYIRWFP